MSRPRKLHKPLKGGFNDILSAVAMGSGKGKRAAKQLQRTPVKAHELQARRAKKP
jgi:hypothetical protein